MRVRQPAPGKGPSAAATGPNVEEPPSPTSSTSSSQFQKEVAEELGSPQVPKAASTAAVLNNQKPPVAGGLTTQKSSLAGISTQKSNPAPDTTIKSAPAQAEPKQIEAAPPSSSPANENGNPPTKDTIMEETIRVTRGRLRKARSAGTS